MIASTQTTPLLAETLSCMGRFIMHGCKNFTSPMGVVHDQLAKLRDLLIDLQ